MIIVRYNVIEADTIADVVRLANNILATREGWETDGPIQHNPQPMQNEGRYFLQMVKREDSPPGPAQLARPALNR